MRLLVECKPRTDEAWIQKAVETVLLEGWYRRSPIQYRHPIQNPQQFRSRTYQFAHAPCFYAFGYNSKTRLFVIDKAGTQQREKDLLRTMYTKDDIQRPWMGWEPSLTLDRHRSYMTGAPIQKYMNSPVWGDAPLYHHFVSAGPHVDWDISWLNNPYNVSRRGLLKTGIGAIGLAGLAGLGAIDYTYASPTYYIAPNGNDTIGDGSVNNPWKTFAKGCAALPSQGMLLVKDGTYVEQLNNIVKGGGSDWTQATVIQGVSYRGATVTKGPNDIFGFRFKNSSSKYIIFKDIRGNNQAGQSISLWSDDPFGGPYVYGYPTHMRFEGVEVGYAGLELLHGGSSWTGIPTPLQSSKNEFLGCWFHHTGAGQAGGATGIGQAQAIYFAEKETLWRGCQVTNSGGQAYTVGTSGGSQPRDCVIERVVMTDIGFDSGSSGGSAIEFSETLRFWVRNCLMYNIAHDGLRAGTNVGALLSSQLDNNTITKCSRYGINIENPTSVGNQCRNNVVYGNGTGAVGAQIRAFVGGTPVNNITNDPKFVNGVAGDFHLGAGSPAIGAGQNLSGFFTDDLEGKTRELIGSWDAGAFDVVGTAPDTTPPLPPTNVQIAAGGTMIAGSVVVNGPPSITNSQYYGQFYTLNASLNPNGAVDLTWVGNPTYDLTNSIGVFPAGATPDPSNVVWRSEGLPTGSGVFNVELDPGAYDAYVFWGSGYTIPAILAGVSFTVSEPVPVQSEVPPDIIEPLPVVQTPVTIDVVPIEVVDTGYPTDTTTVVETVDNIAPEVTNVPVSQAVVPEQESTTVPTLVVGGVLLWLLLK